MIACYHPLTAVWQGEYTDAGKRKYRILQGTIDPREFKPPNEAISVPCGRCIGCRLDYSRKWADRMMLELETCKHGIFVTLTYNDSHAHPCEYASFVPPNTLFPAKPHEIFSDNGEWLLPVSYTLDYRDFQLFIKRLRRFFDGRDSSHPLRKIRFYLAGEYGEKYHRPHGHAIIFGISLDDLRELEKDKFVEIGKNELGDSLYSSGILFDCWDHRGNVVVADVSWKTCAYVARYVTKKMSGDKAEIYDLYNCEKEKALMSRKPGIGSEYLHQHPDCLDYQNINISTPDGGLKITIPKYYITKLNAETYENEPNPLYNPEKFDKLTSERLRFSSDRLYNKLLSTDLSYADYLSKVEEQNKLRSAKALKRKISLN